MPADSGLFEDIPQRYADWRDMILAQPPMRLNNWTYDTAAEPEPSRLWSPREDVPDEYEDDIPVSNDDPWPVYYGLRGEAPLTIRNKEGEVIVTVLPSGEVKAQSIPDLEEGFRIIAETYGSWHIPDDRPWEDLD